MNFVKKNRRRLLVLCNAVIALALITYIVLFAVIIRQNSVRSEIEQITESVDNLSRRSIVTFDASSQTVRDWLHYAHQNNWSESQLLQVLRQLNSDPDVEVQLLDPETLEGFSTRARASGQTDADRYRVNYSKYYSLNIELAALQGSAEDTVVITSPFTNDITVEQCIAFAGCVSVTDEEGAHRLLYLLRVEPLSRLQSDWNSAVDSGTQISLVNAEGEYLFRASLFKNNNFFEFLRSYNELTQPELDSLQQSIADDPDAGWFIYKNAQGKDTLFAYSSKSYNNWFFVGALETSALQHTTLQWQLILVLALGLVALGAVNITYFAQMNRELRQSMSELEVANAAKTRFLSSMSHDIRTPMNAILGMTTVAQHSLNDPAKVADCLNKVSLTGSHLLTLINDVLDISKIESGKFTLSPRPISLRREIENLMNIEMPQAKAKGIQLELHTDELPQDYLFADPLRLNQIWINLSSNAIKYTPSGGHVDMLLREVTLPDEPDRVKLIYQVTDNGIGMSQEFMKTLFEPFARERDTRIDKIEGSGLGLAITKQMVELMGGTISVQSRQGMGSTFTVTLTLPVSAAPAHTEDDDPCEATGGFAGMHLLVAEDNDLNWEVLHEMLGFVDVSADRAANGAECLRMITEAPANRYDLVFMDIQMPVLNGYDAARAIRRLPDPAKASIPIVAMTADAFAEDVAAAQQAGMNGHISKPIEMELIVTQLQKYATKKENPSV